MIRQSLRMVVLLALLLAPASLAWGQSDSPLRRAQEEPDDLEVSETPEPPADALTEEPAPADEVVADDALKDDAVPPETVETPSPQADPLPEDVAPAADGAQEEPTEGTTEGTTEEPSEEPTEETAGETAGETEPVPADSSPPAETGGRQASRARLELIGGVSVPTTGQKIGGGVGGFIGYDLWDRYGFELLLGQFWGGMKWDDENDIKTRLLLVKPGLRYRFMTWKEDTVRLYAAVHAGLAQNKWRKPGSDFDSYREAFGFDGGVGAEFRFSRLILVDVFALYNVGMNLAPKSSGGYRTVHGLIAGVGLGVSSTLK